MAFLTDGIYATGSGIELTTVWGINGALQHFWNPRWRTSLYGGYVEVDYDNTARTFICGSPAANFTVTNCQPNSSWSQLGTRTQWNPHPDLDIGVDVLWTHLNTAFKGPGVVTAAVGARPPGLYAIDDQDVLSVMFRIQRNFLP